MFISFCIGADDAAAALEQFGQSILGAMTDKNYKELSVIICKGLTLLIRSSQLSLENGSGMNDEEEEEDGSEDDSEEDDSVSQMSEDEAKSNQDDLDEIVRSFIHSFIHS